MTLLTCYNEDWRQGNAYGKIVKCEAKQGGPLPQRVFLALNAWPNPAFEFTAGSVPPRVCAEDCFRPKAKWPLLRPTFAIATPRSATSSGSTACRYVVTTACRRSAGRDAGVGGLRNTESGADACAPRLARPLQSAGDPFTMEFDTFVELCLQTRILDEAECPSLTLRELETIFINVNVAIDKDPRNPEHAFVRFQFIEAIIRLALARYARRACTAEG